MSVSIISRIKFLAAALALVSTGSMDACTGIKLAAADGSSVNGRTCEFGIDLALANAFVPRGHQFTGTTPKGNGLSYQSKYAAVGTIAFGVPTLLDGLNEKGLSAGAFYFPGFAQYADITSENQSKAVSPNEFINWVLSQFATIEEVKEGLANIVIAPTVYKDWGSEPAPFHFIIYEKTGKSLVIEPIKGKLVTYDNPIGVITNSPNFEWHMNNLRNYIKLSPFNANDITLAGMTIYPFGQGSGMIGLPGDFTPPSRFIRAVFYSLSADHAANADAAVDAAFHVLDLFDIPKGIVREEHDGKINTDYTLATTVKDPQGLKYYFKTYDNQTLKVIDLNKIDLNAKGIKVANVSGKTTAVDVSTTLK